MLTKAFLPVVQKNADDANGNWDAVMTETALSIAVYTGDKDAWDKALTRWRKRVQEYIYMKKDGSRPKGYDAHRWYDNTYFEDGSSQELCRDLQHSQYGLMGLVNTAETAWHQGEKLYEDEEDRLFAGLEFAASFLAGEKVPSGLCGGKLDKTDKIDPTWEIAYNHFHNRKGKDMPFTEKVVQKVRPTGAKEHMQWETLTHYGQGNSRFFNISQMIV